MERLYLGNHGGETMQIRFYKAYSGGSCYTGQNCVLIDDLCVTDVLAPQNPENYTVGKVVRSLPLSGLTPGATYTFTVTPTVSGALVEGEASVPMTVSIAGERRTPVPGTETFTSENLVFSTGDTSGVWSYSGTARSSTSIRDVWNNSITVNLQGTLTASSALSFNWMANCYYQSGAYDTFSAVFKCDDGTEYSLWSVQNTSIKTTAQNVSVSLTDYVGKKGKIVISYSHSGSNYTSDSNGGTLSDVQVTNVSVPSVPAVAWETETLTALGTPEILSVTSVSEGFYGECGLGTTTFSVTCSENVTSLQALPSHLALVSDNDVTVTSRGNGQFSVSVRPSGITEDNLRSRMILTLAATDSNGTTAYKDLSLRFAPMEAVAAVTVTAQSASGAELTAVIPYTWFVENGLASSGAANAAFEQAAYADSDGDGMANWAEYVCQTDPRNADEKLVCSIEVVDGKGKVSYRPSNIRPGYRAVVKGTDDLRATEWTTVTTETSSLHFFKVVIEME